MLDNVLCPADPTMWLVRFHASCKNTTLPNDLYLFNAHCRILYQQKQVLQLEILSVPKLDEASSTLMSCCIIPTLVIKLCCRSARIHTHSALMPFQCLPMPLSARGAGNQTLNQADLNIHLEICLPTIYCCLHAGTENGVQRHTLKHCK